MSAARAPPRHRFRGEAGKRFRRAFSTRRVAAGILIVDVPAPERGHHPPCPAARVRRHQCGGLAEMLRLPQRHRDRERLHFRIGRRDPPRAVFMPLSTWAAMSGLPQPVVPLRPLHSTAASFSDSSTLAPPRAAGRLQDLYVAAPDAKAIEQRRALRIADGSRAGCSVKRPVASRSASRRCLARTPRRDRCRGPGRINRALRQLRHPRAGILRWSASNRSSPRRSPGLCDVWSSPLSLGCDQKNRAASPARSLPISAR